MIAVHLMRNTPTLRFSRAHYRWWLENKTGSELFQSALNSPLQEPLKIYPVGNLVNNPKTDDPRCIEPAQIDRDMFEKPWWGN
jgi:putative SOS response-associated peptidase YedK